MNTPIESPLTLEAVAEHFAQWRKGRKRGERIPDSLWNEAVSLVGRDGVSQVTRTLRLSGTDLNKRRGIVGTAKRRHSAGGKPAFVEVTPALVDRAPGPQATTAWMELERPDGMRLRIGPSGGGELLALVDRFLGG
jgi:hypothetical protein